MNAGQVEEQPLQAFGFILQVKAAALQIRAEQFRGMRRFAQGNKPRPLAPAMFAQHLQHLRIVIVGQAGDLRLDDPGFFCSDHRQGIAQVLLMIHPDRGDGGGQRGEHVGGIQPPAHPGFDDRDIHPAVGEVAERQGSGHLKE